MPDKESRHQIVCCINDVFIYPFPYPFFRQWIYHKHIDAAIGENLAFVSTVYSRNETPETLSKDKFLPAFFIIRKVTYCLYNIRQYIQYNNNLKIMIKAGVATMESSIQRTCI